MAHPKYAKIRVRPIVYSRNTNGEIDIDENGDKIVLIQPENVTSEMDYDYLIEVTETI
jgi:hypothetical protein